MQILSTSLKLGKSTKGTHVYENDGEPKLSLYFPRGVFPNPDQPPVTVKVTLETTDVL
jgi:hypothetical protein